MILAVASGKGGTGKTMVATSLALSLQDHCRVQILDCDVEEPDAAILLRPEIELEERVCLPVPVVDLDRCTRCGLCSEACAFHAILVLGTTTLVLPELCHGCGACAHVCPEKAITEQGREVGAVELGRVGGLSFAAGRLNVGEPMAGPVIRAVKRHADPSRLVIVDAPPGTACPVVETLKGSDFCLLVTEPTPFGLSDMTLAVEVVKELALPCGVVVNKDGTGAEGIEEYCRKQEIPILMRIPLDRGIAELYCRGVTLAEGMPAWGDAFRHLHDDVVCLAGREARAR